MFEVYTCICGGQRWGIKYGGIICTKCNREYLLDIIHPPKKFNDNLKEHLKYVFLKQEDGTYKEWLLK